MKPIAWIDDSLERLREFPQDARNDAGYQLEQVQRGDEPANWNRTFAAALQGNAGEKEAGMSEKIRITLGSGNVFRDLGFGKAEAENLRLRSELMMRIDAFHCRSGMTQREVAKLLGLTQPRLNALLKGRLSQFSLDALVNIASRAGMNVRLVVKKAA